MGKDAQFRVVRVSEVKISHPAFGENTDCRGELPTRRFAQGKGWNHHALADHPSEGGSR
jgi:hypothetical protein